jgi:16S rRNA processing protein RimM
MKSPYLEAGRIVNTHGIQGEVKIEPWADSADFLLGFRTFYIDGVPTAVLSARVHGRMVLARLEGIGDY